MRRAVTIGSLLSVAILTTGCGDVSSVRDGDTLTPVMAGSNHWTAGKHEQIAVRLQAKNADGSSARSVGFGGIPDTANPTAAVTFYIDDQPQPPVQVSLNHRC
jgi:hypothetical protein